MQRDVNKKSSHPSSRELADFVDGKLNRDRRAEITKHLIACDECSDVVALVMKYGKKKPKVLNNIYYKGLGVALVASLIIFIFPPQQDRVIIGMIDLSSLSNFRAVEKEKQKKIIDGDKFLKQIKESTDINYLEAFNQAESESDFYEAIGLYQEAINSIEANEEERLKQTIIIHSKMLQRAIEEKQEQSIKAYKELVIENIRTYYLKYQKQE